MAELLLVAASGLAREAANVVRATGSHKLIGYLDDDPSIRGVELHGLTVHGGLERVADHPDAQLVVCAGRGSIRADMVARLDALGVAGYRYARVIDPSVHVPDDCRIGPGAIVLAHVSLTAQVSVGAHVVAMPGVTLTHDNVVDNFCTLCAGVTLGGGVRLRRCAYLGMNSCVREGLEVGEKGFLGMGAALVDDLPAGQTWVGVPARPLAEADGHHRAPLTGRGLLT